MMSRRASLQTVLVAALPLSVLFCSSCVFAFSSNQWRQQQQQQQLPYSSSGVIRYAEANDETTNNSIDVHETIMFPDAEMKEFELLPHRPLGMTVEESLADSRFVFITQIKEGGNAEAAGLRVGDTLVQVTGLFGELTPVIGKGMEKIKGMVSSRPADEPLKLQIARGTTVMDEHEEAVIELCANESSDQEVEQCIIGYLSMDLEEAKELTGKNNKSNQRNEDEEEECDPNVDDADCLVDNLMGLWAGDLPTPVPSTSTMDDSDSSDLSATGKPWSSRSSPSGTFVRDPVTGEMKNIDA